MSTLKKIIRACALTMLLAVAAAAQTNLGPIKTTSRDSVGTTAVPNGNPASGICREWFNVTTGFETWTGPTGSSCGGGIASFFGNTTNPLTALVDPTTIADANGNYVRYQINEYSWSDNVGDGCFGMLGTMECLDGSGDAFIISDGVFKVMPVGGGLSEFGTSFYNFYDGTATTISSAAGKVTVTGLLAPTFRLSFDASLYTSGSAGTCVLGTSDSKCIRNAIQAIVGTPGSTGGYGIIDATKLGVNGQAVLTENPFTDIISNGTTQEFSAPVKCGTIIMNPGINYGENLPGWLPRCWDMQWSTLYSQGGIGISPTASWPATVTGTATNAAGVAIFPGQYQFIAVASSTFSSAPQRGQIYNVCTSTGAGGPGCGGVTAGFTNSSAVITATNNFAAGEPVEFSTTGTLPTNFAINTNYYVISTGLSGTQFEVSAAPPIPGVSPTAVVAGSAGSGTQSVYGPTQCGTACGSSAWGIVLAVGQTVSVNTSGTGCSGGVATLVSGAECVSVSGTLGTAFTIGQPIVVAGISPTGFNCTNIQGCLITAVTGSGATQAVTFNNTGSATYTSAASATVGAFSTNSTSPTLPNSVIVGANNSAHANANASAVNFIIFGDLFSLGSVSQMGSDAGGASSTITGGAYSCGDNTNVAFALSNYSVQEKSFWKDVQVQHCIWHDMTVQSSGAINSGPYTEMVINKDSSCVSDTLPIVIRVQNTKNFANFTINADQTNCAAIGIDLESGTEVSHYHQENNNNTPNAIAVSIGQNASSVPITICPVGCVEPTNTPQGAKIDAQDLSGTFNPVNIIGTAYPASASVYFSNLKDGSAIGSNVLIADGAVNNAGYALPIWPGCVVSMANGDNYLQLYARNGNDGTVVSTATSSATTCPLTPGVLYRTASAATNTNIAATVMLTTANNSGQNHQYTLNWYVDLTTVGTTCTGSTTVVLNAIFFDPAAGSAQTVAIQTITIATLGVGTVGYVASGSFPLLAKPNTTVRYSTTGYTAGTACTVNPTYQVYPTLVMNW